MTSGFAGAFLEDSCAKAVRVHGNIQTAAKRINGFIGNLLSKAVRVHGNIQTAAKRITVS